MQDWLDQNSVMKALSEKVLLVSSISVGKTKVVVYKVNLKQIVGIITNWLKYYHFQVSRTDFYGSLHYLGHFKLIFIHLLGSRKT